MSMSTSTCMRMCALKASAWSLHVMALESVFPDPASHMPCSSSSRPCHGAVSCHIAPHAIVLHSHMTCHRMACRLIAQPYCMLASLSCIACHRIAQPYCMLASFGCFACRRIAQP
eukprot:365643-Chlamydomonas_euryale.AAC.19